jgi:two-component system, cell cycle response regulator
MKVVINAGEPLLEKTLTRWGYDVRIAEDGRQALELLTQEDPATLAILNSEMNGFRGAELCRQLRAESGDQYIYVILLSDKSQGDDLLEAFEEGADDYITKPYDGYALRAKLLVAKRILSLQERLLAMRDELLVQATRDSLTGLWNRRATMESLARELSRGAREKRPVGLMLADIDHFKKINDTYGHLAGDCVLQTVSTRLKNAMRTYDTVGRYGGEEFFIISPGCDEEALSRRAESLRSSIAREPVATSEGSIPVTLSLGAVVAATELPQDQLIKAADEALYRAKRAGRNRVELAEMRPAAAR